MRDERRRAFVDSHKLIHGEPWSDTVHLTFDCHEKVVESDTEHFQADHAHHPPKR